MIKPWGISIEWDEDGLECAAWARHRTGRRLEFDTKSSAGHFIKVLLMLPSGMDVIATPRQIV